MFVENKRCILGKRIFRLKPELALQDSQLVGKEMNFILHDRTVFFGVLKKVEGTVFKCQNMKGKNFQFSASEISEIVYDKASSF